ncbi:hypothetical protein BJV78DRAFT_1282437 [Lactifluus subvellereus]|nr:hypothetical protein BJV78DRAFT_1282437 [Lactifluus subvellereus]
MLLYLTSRVVSCLSAFLYPGYASFKTLSQRPASEEDLERWLMYWSVLACVVAVEYLAEWLISWSVICDPLPSSSHSLIDILRVPFYYFFKMLFLLYLALPQTQGASYLYQTQLEPILRAHEQQIDAALAQLRARAFTFLQARARMLWDYIVTSASTPQPAPAVGSSSGTSAQAPALSDSVSGPTQMLGTLWRTYGPALVAGGTALLQRQGVAPNPGASSRTVDATAIESPRGYDVGDGPEPVPMPRMQNRTSSSGSAAGLRERVASSTNIGPGGRFEEIEVPSDAESERLAGSPPAAPPRPSSGWFGWISTAPTHTKTD